MTLAMTTAAMMAKSVVLNRGASAGSVGSGSVGSSGSSGRARN